MREGVVGTVTYMADTKALSVWAERAKKAHYNAVENLAPFAGVVIVAHVTQTANATTAMAAVIYFWARLRIISAISAGCPLSALRPLRSAGSRHS